MIKKETIHTVCPKTINQIDSTDNSGNKRLKESSNSYLAKDYVNETHIIDFVNALAYDGNEYIVTWTDSASIIQPSKRKIKYQEAAKPKGLSHQLLQYPLVLTIGIFLFFELTAYVSIRQMVRIWEKCFSWRGEKRRLRNKLSASENYEAWCDTADELDRYMHKDEWKKAVPYAYYDYRLIQKVIKHLRKYRYGKTEEDANKLVDVLYICLKQNFAGIENSKLYSNTHLGTKVLIEEYVKEVTTSIESIANNQFLSKEQKKLAFKLYSKNYGRTAFCLSGGAGFGYYHLGVIRALLDRGLLPSIITGTSAGSLMGAIVCTRTNEELSQILRPELADRIKICQDSWTTKIKRFATTGALFDSSQWCREAMWFCQGSITFKEAYEKTGRIFNVSVIPSDPHSPAKLLNYITAPDCVIWSAVLASSAVPGILNPVVLMQKKKGTDHLVPYNYGNKFKDGSLSTDIPTLALNTLFNVNYTIVSQVNPHIHVFFYANQGSPGSPVSHLEGHGWRGGFLASIAEQILKLELSKWLKLLKVMKLLPKVHDQDWSSVFLQKFDGNVTIWPKSTIGDWFYTIADPGQERLEKLMKIGQIRTWPNISMISNRMQIEASIEEVRKSLRNEKNAQKSINNKLSVEYCSDIGSVDELSFLSRRRVSLPNGSPIDDSKIEQFLKEQSKRRRFKAQYKEKPNSTSTKSLEDTYLSQSDTESSSFPSENSHSSSE